MPRTTHPNRHPQAPRTTRQRNAARCSGGKVRYDERHDALLALRNCRAQAGAARRAGLTPGREECRTYRCDTCSGWHLTSQKKVKSLQRRGFGVPVPSPALFARRAA